MSEATFGMGEQDTPTEVIAPVGAATRAAGVPVAAVQETPAARLAASVGSHADTARNPKLPWIVALCIVAALVVAAVAAAVGFGWHYRDRVAPGVRFGTVEVVGQNRDELSGTVRQAVDDSSVTVLGEGGEKAVASLKDLGVTVDVKGTVDALLSAKPGDGLGGALSRINPFVHRDVPLKATVDDYAMSQWLTDRFVTPDRQAVPSTIAFDGEAGAFTVTAGRDGTSPKPTAVRHVVDGIIASPGEASQAKVSFASVTMPISVDTANQAAAAANQRVSSQLVISNGNGKQMTLPADQIASWIKPAPDPQKGTIDLTYDGDAVKTYLAQAMPAQLNQDMVKEKNVVNKDGGAVLYREVQGVDGVTVEDTDATAAQVVQALQNGQGATVDAKVTVTKFETENRVVDYTSPNGDPHAVIDLSSQTASFYRGSTLVKTFLVSTGAPGHDTPRGTFFVQRKLSSDNMRGPGYFTPNVPWCTYFTSSGVAFHGAPWNPGGISSGTPKSHGCINMNVGDAKWVYDFLPTGAMVQVNGSTPGGSVR